MRRGAAGAPAGCVATVMRCDCLVSPLVWSLTPFSACTLNVYDRPALSPATNTLQRQTNTRPSNVALDDLYALFIPGTFLGGGDFPKKLTIPLPQTAAKLCAVDLFGRDNKLQIYHENFLLMDNKQKKLLVTK